MILQKSDFSEFIHEVAERTNIETIIRTYYNEPDRHGKWFCPFHNEKTPSFSVKNNRFHCFGCGIGGDSVKFVSELYTLKAYEAALKINQDFGLNIKPPTETKAEEPAPKPKQRPLTEYEKKRLHEEWTIETHDILLDYMKLLEKFSEEHPQINDNGEIVTGWKYSAYCNDYQPTKFIVNMFTESRESRAEIFENWHDTAEKLKANFIEILKKERIAQNAK